MEVITRKYYWWKYLLGRLPQKALIWLIWRLPKRVIYWSAIRMLAVATTGKYSNQIVTELTALEALARWGYDS